MNLKFSLVGLAASMALTTAMAAPELYTVEPMHTYPSFSASHDGLTFWRAKFTKTTGKIWIDREKGDGKVEIAIDTRSVNFGLPYMDQLARGDTFFNVAKYPTATYTSDSMTFKNGVPATVNGNLTLLGITLPVPLVIESFTCKPHPYLKREVCGVVAHGELNRTQFGMTREAQNDPMVRLTIDVEAMRGDQAMPPPPPLPPESPASAARPSAAAP
jgi:polyisoprenoid-binding protein YceI